MHFNPKWLPPHYHQATRSVPKGERDHQLLSKRPSCKLNALSPLHHSMYSWFPRPYASVRPLFLNQQEYPVSVPTNEVRNRAAPSHHSADREAFVCLLTLFPPFIPIPIPLLSQQTTPSAATTSPSTPTRSSSRSRGANLMTYCRHCSRGLTKKAKFSHNVPSVTTDVGTDRQKHSSSIEQKESQHSQVSHGDFGLKRWYCTAPSGS